MLVLSTAPTACCLSNAQRWTSTPRLAPSQPFASSASCGRQRASHTAPPPPHSLPHGHFAAAPRLGAAVPGAWESPRLQHSPRECRPMPGVASAQGSGSGGQEQQQPGQQAQSNGAASVAQDDVAASVAQEEALKALDRQLADLASGQRPLRVGDTLKPAQGPEERFKASGGASSSMQVQQPTLLGRDANPEGWPEFDPTFFTYTSLVLLVLTALTNWGYTAALGQRDPAAKEEAGIERAARRSRMNLLYQQVLEDASDSDRAEAVITGAELNRTLRGAFEQVAPLLLN